MRIVVTVDTEADGQWAHGRPLTTENVAWWAPFQALCERARGAADLPRHQRDRRRRARRRRSWRRWPAAERPRSAPTCTRGRRRRSATSPASRRNDPAHAYPCQLDEALLAAKLRDAHGADRGRVRRAARRRSAPGASASTPTGARLLAELGYVVDSSVTPYVSWAGNPGRPGWGEGPTSAAMTPTRSG